MKIIRYFMWTDDDWSGLSGWTPLWIPRSADFDPGEGRSVIHDAMEHRLCDTGQFHEEVMAFGRIIALRVESGVSAEGMFRSSPEEAFGHELADIHERAGRPSIKLAPRCVPYPDIKSSIQVICRAFAERASVDPEEVTAVAGWLNIGYRDALRLYGGHRNCHSLGWHGHYEAQRLDKLQAEPNDVLRFCLDTNTNRINTRVLSPYDTETGVHPYWLRQRINHWMNS